MFRIIIFIKKVVFLTYDSLIMTHNQLHWKLNHFINLNNYILNTGGWVQWIGTHT